MLYSFYRKDKKNLNPRWAGQRRVQVVGFIDPSKWKLKNSWSTMYTTIHVCLQRIFPTVPWRATKGMQNCLTPSCSYWLHGIRSTQSQILRCPISISSAMCILTPRCHALIKIRLSNVQHTVLQTRVSFWTNLNIFGKKTPHSSTFWLVYRRTRWIDRQNSK